MKINHNIPALRTLNSLSKVDGGISKVMGRLSSGLRINSASDDAAGMAIAQKMDTQVRGLEQANRNAMDGISLLQTAEGAYNEIQSMLQRMNELAVQAANDTYQESDRVRIQEEITALSEEVKSISERTQFNKKNILDGSNSTIILQTGANKDQTMVLDFSKVNVKTQVLNLIAPVNTGADTGAQVNKEAQVDAGINKEIQVDTRVDKGTQVDIGIDKGIQVDAGIDKEIQVDTGVGVGTQADTGAQVNAGANAGAQVNAGTDAGAQVNKETQVDTGIDKETQVDAGAQVNKETQVDTGIDKGTQVDTGVDAGTQVDTGVDAETQVGTTVSTNSVAPGIDVVNKPQEAIAQIQQAIENASAVRSKLGAYQNRLEHTVSNLGTSNENMTAAMSRIQDADMAKEMAEYTKLSILSKASTSMLAQANQRPQQILELLQR